MLGGLGLKPEVAELFGAGVALEAVELLAVNPEGVAGSGLPAEHSVNDFIELVQAQ